MIKSCFRSTHSEKLSIIKPPTRNRRTNFQPLQESALSQMPKQASIMSAQPVAWKVVSGVDGVSTCEQNTAVISAL